MARSNISDSSESYLNRLSSIENNISVLYTALSDRVTMPPAKAMLSHVAADCQRNSVILTGFGKDVVEPEAKSKESAKELAEVFDSTYDVYKRIIEKEKIVATELHEFTEQLVALEGILGEKYQFVHLKTSKLVMRESVRLIHGLDLDKLGLMFNKLLCAVEARRSLLGSVKSLAEEKVREETKRSTASEGFIVFSPVLDQVATPYCGK